MSWKQRAGPGWRSRVRFGKRRVGLLVRLRARRLHRGPRLALSIRNWIMVASMSSPIWPPRASISRTRLPLAIPPMAGLQDMRPIASRLCVTRSVENPRRARARAASMPACPAADHDGVVVARRRAPTSPRRSARTSARGSPRVVTSPVISPSASSASARSTARRSGGTPRARASGSAPARRARGRGGPAGAPSR